MQLTFLSFLHDILTVQHFHSDEKNINLLKRSKTVTAGTNCAYLCPQSYKYISFRYSNSNYKYLSPMQNGKRTNLIANETFTKFRFFFFFWHLITLTRLSLDHTNLLILLGLLPSPPSFQCFPFSSTSHHSVECLP